MLRAILVALILPACACAGQLSWARGYGLSDDQWTEVGRAAEAWCHASDGRCCPALDETAPRYVHGLSLEALSTYGGRPPDPARLGSYRGCDFEVAGPGYSCRREIVLLAELAPADLYWVTVHEFGHSCGLAHNADPDSIMHPYMYPGEQRILSSDLEGLL